MTHAALQKCLCVGSARAGPEVNSAQLGPRPQQGWVRGERGRLRNPEEQGLQQSEQREGDGPGAGQAENLGECPGQRAAGPGAKCSPMPAGHQRSWAGVGGEGARGG